MPMEETPDLSNGGYEMLVAAVNIAREAQCRNVATLKDRMLARFPKRGDDIQQALVYWAKRLHELHPEGMRAA